jgi:hypothetical protein
VSESIPASFPLPVIHGTNAPTVRGLTRSQDWASADR